MSIYKYGEEWIAGFAEETARLGLNEDGAKELLKLAAALDLKHLPEFREGFDKAAATFGAGGILGAALKKLWSTPLGATAGTLALPAAGAAGYYGIYRPFWGQGPYERQVQRLRDAVDYGLLDEDQMMAALRASAIGSAKRRATAAGYEPYS